MSTTTKKILNVIKTLPEAKASIDVLVDQFGAYRIVSPHLFRLYADQIIDIIHTSDSRFKSSEIDNAIITRLYRVPLNKRNRYKKFYSNDRRRLISRLQYQERIAYRKKMFKERFKNLLEDVEQ